MVRDRARAVAAAQLLGVGAQLLGVAVVQDWGENARLPLTMVERVGAMGDDWVSSSGDAVYQ